MKGLISILAGIMLVTIACKKEVKPTLVITVQDTTGVKLANARVFTHPCFDSASCAGYERINENFIKSGLTNSSGQISFVYPYSAIIDVAAQWTNCDTPDVYCLYVGRTVARFETQKLKKDEKNEFYTTITLYEE